MRERSSWDRSVSILPHKHYFFLKTLKIIITLIFMKRSYPYPRYLNYPVFDFRLPATRFHWRTRVTRHSILKEWYPQSPKFEKWSQEVKSIINSVGSKACILDIICLQTWIAFSSRNSQFFSISMSLFGWWKLVTKFVLNGNTCKPH